MKILSKTKIQNILFTGLSITLFTACGGTSTSTYDYMSGSNEKIVLGIDNPTCLIGDASQEGRLIDFSTKKGLSNAHVEIAGCEVTTDSKGYYTFSNIPSSSRVSVNFKKEGYNGHSEIIQIKDKTSNYLKTSLHSSMIHKTYESQNGTQSDMLTIDSEVNYLNEDNTNYSGEVNLYYSYKDTTTSEGRDMFPGTYQGKDTNGVIVSFESYALMLISLKDKDNNPLNISNPIKLTVKNTQGLTDESLPMWYYNKDQGIWIQKGDAQQDEHGNYICEIPFTGTWSLNKPVETEMGTYKGQIVDADKNPLSNVRVQAKGKNWIGKDLTTDKNGEFTLDVVPNKSFTFSAYNYEEKFSATFPDTLKGIASGDVLED
ncbi:MAG: hypothetical protein L3J43_03545 [Sulfurovum sp.]|nr:hypothetical protein [Sulfurovum sp.]